MSKNKRGLSFGLSCFALVLLGFIPFVNAQTPSPNGEKPLINDTASFRISDLVNNERGLKSVDPLKAETAAPISRPPPIPLNAPVDLMSNASIMPSKTIDLVGIYYAKEFQKAEILIGGFAHYYTQGDRLISRWILKTIEPSSIEMQRCGEKTKHCEFKTIEFTPSVRD